MRRIGMQANWIGSQHRVRIALCLIAIGWLGASIVATVWHLT